MSESNVGWSGRVQLLRPILALRLPDWSLRDVTAELTAIAVIALMLLSVAVWNRFPLTFYDTGGYILQGMASVFVPERSPVYSFFLRLGGGRESLWCIAAIQSAIIAYAIVEFARIEAPNTSFWRITGIGAFLCLCTGIAWTSGEIEPDCFTAIVVLGTWLLAFRARELGVVRAALLLAFTALAIGSHPAHLALAAGLVVVVAIAALLALRYRGQDEFPRANPLLPLLALVLAIGSVVVSNYVITKHVFISRAGGVFVTARMIEDGVAKRVLDDVCPTPAFKLCRYKDHLPPTADHYLWDADSPFNKLGRFAGTAKESQALMLEGFKRYPLREGAAMLWNGTRQFFMFRTGDGVAPQEWVLDTEFRNFLPDQIKAYMAARQQREVIRFVLINIVHVGIAALALFVLGVATWNGIRARHWSEVALPAFMLVAFAGNALVCGALSGPHDRYQSRLIWVAVFVTLLLGRPLFLALRRPAESGT